ncbi:MAG: VanZ family protein [Lachnospiraceae bacterium]|nr:VanZ family protein [Lachnospiraceae bacterium]
MVLTVITGLLLSLLYVAIFSFSEQEAEESSSLSREVTEKCVETVTELSGKKLTDSLKAQLVEKFEKPVRKAAHFTEYAGMGILVYALLSLWYEKSRTRFLFNIGWVFVSAAFDECHQLFVAGRSGSFFDVLIDTAGGLFGMAIVLLSLYIYYHLFFKIYSVALRRKNV